MRASQGVGRHDVGHGIDVLPELGVLDLAGVGVGPANLALAALADGLAAAFFDRTAEFAWHPGLLIDGTTLQVPFLADLVSMVDPTHPLSFLAYLRAHDRLFPFYLAERFHIPRAEYDSYCRWAAAALPSCRFGHDVRAVAWSDVDGVFELDLSPGGTVRARNVVLGVGTEPSVPTVLADLVADRDAAVWHSADYLTVRSRLLAAGEVTVIGSGQSGAEVVLDLLRARVDGVHWLARTPAFAPMEYSKLGLEQFTPDHTRYFHRLDPSTRDTLVPAQWQLYKGISADTMAEIHDELYRATIGGAWPATVLAPGVEVVGARRVAGRIELDLRHVAQDTTATMTTDAVVCATGYAERDLSPLLAGIEHRLERDEQGRLVVDADYRVASDLPGAIYVQNAERHTHGVGAPDLGLVAWRAATIVNSVSGRVVHPLPDRTAFTSFGLPAEWSNDDG